MTATPRPLPQPPPPADGLPRGDTQQEESSPGRGSCCPACQTPLTDELTGVLDRRRWNHDASQALLQARHRPWPLALILVDLDRFKDINDLYGHPAGDAVLRAAATALRQHSGERGIVGRYGGHTGDEFLILLPDTNLDGALAVAQNIQVHISSLSVQAMTSCDSAVTITGQTVSMGVAACTDLIPGDLSELLLECDVALRDAKRSGGNQTCVAGSPAALSHHGRSPVVDEVHRLADGDVCIPLARYLRATPSAPRSLVLSPESAQRLHADLTGVLGQLVRAER
ncbi:GGDEF domain-containing protein [Streptomyces sp. 5-6(2022)]|uniref:GGDEF domain-containing protein n=1 Tax=Streptomyces sp. 5-6(2022) TaxID=2936510 RepID=UPI0023BA02AE|nr:GGDEF domain-containing protein [Streptomyces sp. 5-6(2022)]